MVPEQTHK